MPKMSQAAQDDTEHRRKQLQRWIDERFNGKQADFVSAHKLNQGEISALLGKKSFGGVKARNLEQQAGMPVHYLDAREALVAPPGHPKEKPLSKRALLLARAFDAAVSEEDKRVAESTALHILQGKRMPQEKAKPTAEPAAKPQRAPKPTREPSLDR